MNFKEMEELLKDIDSDPMLSSKLVCFAKIYVYASLLYKLIIIRFDFIQIYTKNKAKYKAKYIYIYIYSTRGFLIFFFY